jgi:hypothetical protein
MSFFANTPLSVAIEAATVKAEADGTKVTIETVSRGADGGVCLETVTRETLPAALHAAAGLGSSLIIYLTGRNDSGCLWGEFGPEGFEWRGSEASKSVVMRFLSNLTEA